MAPLSVETCIDVWWRPLTVDTGTGSSFGAVAIDRVACGGHLWMGEDTGRTGTRSEFTVITGRRTRSAAVVTGRFVSGPQSGRVPAWF